MAIVYRVMFVSVLSAWAVGCSCSGGVDGGLGKCVDNFDCPTLACDKERGVCVPAECGQGYCPDPSTLNPECMDGDGDGHGPMCDLGEDCDDTNPIQVNREYCGDKRDNDCDGEVDEGASKLCECENRCNSDPQGGPGGDPLKPEPENSNGVGVNDDGELVLDSTRINTRIIWIANTQQGTVSKIDTRTYEELARYQTGPNGPVGNFFEGNDPSRTSVNVFSDVYVGNRDHRSVTKISALGDRCPDQNGDGMVTTSTGANDILPWVDGKPTDECILWHTKLDDSVGFIRAVAAQDVSVLDGAIDPVVWVGGWDMKVFKLDGDTGEVLVETDSPVRPYGFALDGGGNLWISSNNFGSGNPYTPGIGRIDTVRCVDNDSCSDPVCGSDMEEAGDACVKQYIEVQRNHYGITVDKDQFVWLGAVGDRPQRYDHTADWGQRFTTVTIDGYAATDTRGVGADALGFVYFAGVGGSPIFQVKNTDPSGGVAIAGTNNGAYGIAIDLDGKVWGISQSSTAMVLTPSQTLGSVTVDANGPGGLVRPYTYSDMTGAQLRLATNPRGYYRQIYRGCTEGKQTTLWEWLDFDVETPAGTRVVWRVRTADTEGALEGAEWITVANIPSDMPPVNLFSAFTDASIDQGAYLEVEVQLISEKQSDSMVVTPTVTSFDVSHQCSVRVD